MIDEADHSVQVVGRLARHIRNIQMKEQENEKLNQGWQRRKLQKKITPILF